MRTPKKNLLVLILSFLVSQVFAQTWIWFPGDHENWLGNQMNNRRTERGSIIPVQWKLDNHQALMIFTKTASLSQPEEIEVFADCDFFTVTANRATINGIPGYPLRLTLPAGNNTVKIKTVSYAVPPAIFVRGQTFNSNSSWTASPLEQNRLTKNMRHPYSPSAYSLRAGSGGLNDPSIKPSEFRLPVKPVGYLTVKDTLSGRLYDFGKETFGFIRFKNLAGNGEMTIQYGETLEEALDARNCETFHTFDIPSAASDYTTVQSNALRFIFIPAFNGSYDDLDLLYEYNPVKYRASFVCSDKLINDIWETGRYTLELTTRELFIDGIKRDRWAWSGDAIQSYLMNYYMFFDTETVKRTIYTLRGNDPVICHLNNIMDYTLYWFISVYEYYLYSGDSLFLEQVYPRMETLMDFVLDRRNSNGLLTGLQGDWVYVDWVDGRVDISGEVSFEQILFCKALETMAECATILGIGNESKKYASLAGMVREQLDKFWDPDDGAFIFNIPDQSIEGYQEYSGNITDQLPADRVTRHSNMFAINYGYADENQKEKILKNVLLNDKIRALTTPYMRFYELEALCNLGLHDLVLSGIRDYWGGMLSQGATSFWEKYNPAESGTQHYAMYGRPYGKSLCHAWGASPVYLLGRYFAGVRPLKPGYEEFEIRPVLGDMEWFKASVPTPNGDIQVHADRKSITVSSTEGKGRILFRSVRTPSCANAVIEKTTSGEYCMSFPGDGKNYVIKYRSEK